MVLFMIWHHQTGFITGFKAYKEWNKENFCEFITDYGFTVVKVNLVDGGLAPVGVLIAKKTNY